MSLHEQVANQPGEDVGAMFDEPLQSTGHPIDEVFSREYAAMVRLAFLLVDSNELAEDLVQDAFAQLHRRWDRTDNPGAYLRTSVVNGTRSALRRRRLERTLHLRARTETVDAYDEVSDALAKLPARRRAAVVLRFYEDRTEAEIASILGVRPGTVKSMLHRGLAQLRQEMSS